MPCTSPVPVWFHRLDGGRPVFGPHPSPGSADWIAGQISCRECESCLIQLSRHWGVRCAHEAQMHDRNCFVTLTYDQAHMPRRGMLCRRDLDRFIKGLRNWHVRHFSLAHRCDGFKYFGVGEYGETTARPHYHLLAFGLDFDDRVFRSKSKGGYSVFDSATLSSLWSHGLAVVGDATVETAMYCARYSLKKLGASGERVDHSHWKRLADRNWRVDPLTGERFKWQPEFARKSKGLGLSWLERYDSDVFRADDDAVVLRDGSRVSVPDFYLRQLREWCEDDYQVLKQRHKDAAAERLSDLLPSRLAVHAAVVKARQALCRREGV